MARRNESEEEIDVGNIQPGNARKVLKQNAARGSGRDDGTFVSPQPKSDAVGVTLWILDRFVVLGTLATIFGAALIVFLKPGKSEAEYEEMTDAQIMGDMAMSWFEMVWQLLVVLALAWGLARFIRAVAGRA